MAIRGPESPKTAEFNLMPTYQLMHYVTMINKPAPREDLHLIRDLAAERHSSGDSAAEEVVDEIDKLLKYGW